MFTVYVLWFVGLALIFFEFFLPGGVLGVLGGVMLVANLVYFATQAPSALAFMSLVAVTFFGIAVVGKWAMWKIRNSQDNIYHKDDQEGYVGADFDKELLGKTGLALSNLNPSGYVTIDDKKVQAISRSGFIPKGASIEVCGGEGNHLVVRSPMIQSNGASH